MSRRRDGIATKEFCLLVGFWSHHQLSHSSRAVVFSVNFIGLGLDFEWGRPCGDYVIDRRAGSYDLQELWANPANWSWRNDFLVSQSFWWDVTRVDCQRQFQRFWSTFLSDWLDSSSSHQTSFFMQISMKSRTLERFSQSFPGWRLMLTSWFYSHCPEF